MFETLKKWFFGEDYGLPTAGKRVYLFPLPYVIQAVYLHYGINQLKAEGIFQKLPEELQQKWKKSLANWHDLRVTAADLDKIDDHTWSRISTKLKLKWK